MAAICHGPWMLCSTDVLKGRRCTSYMSIAHDVVNAGGKWVDEECVVDGPIITSRTPDDLPAFSNAILQLVSEGKAQGVQGQADRSGVADGDDPRVVARVRRLHRRDAEMREWTKSAADERG